MKHLQSVSALAFFMEHFGYRLMPKCEVTGDLVDDTKKMLSLNYGVYPKLKLPPGAEKPKKGEPVPRSTEIKSVRLASLSLVITPAWVYSSYYFVDGPHFLRDSTYTEMFAKALKEGAPCMAISIGKRSLSAEDLHITYDPRMAIVCEPGGGQLRDFTKEKVWTK